MFNTTNITVYRIRHRLSNPWQIEKFDVLSEEEQRALYDSLQEEFHLIEQNDMAKNSADLIKRVRVCCFYLLGIQRKVGMESAT